MRNHFEVDDEFGNAQWPTLAGIASDMALSTEVFWWNAVGFGHCAGLHPLHKTDGAKHQSAYRTNGNKGIEELRIQSSGGSLLTSAHFRPSLRYNCRRVTTVMPLEWSIYQKLLLNNLTLCWLEQEIIKILTPTIRLKCWVVQSHTLWAKIYTLRWGLMEFCWNADIPKTLDLKQKSTTGLLVAYI